MLYSQYEIVTGRFKKLRRFYMDEVAKLKVREEDLKKYSAAMEACKPIILDAIERRLLAELHDGNGHRVCTVLEKQKALAEYKEKFEVSEIDLIE